MENKNTMLKKPEQIYQEEPVVVEQKPTPIQITEESHDTTIKTEKSITFNFEKPEGWNKKSKKTNIFKVIWDGLRDVGMGPKDQQRYDSFKSNFFIIAIISLLIYIIIAFNSYNTSYNTNKSYIDRFINYCAKKYDKITGRDKLILIIKDTSKPIVIDTPKPEIKIDTPIVIVPVVEEPKPVIKDTLVKKPIKVINKNKKENLIEYIRTLPEYSKFGPLDLPYLTQDANKIDWSFLRADGKIVQFHYNYSDGTFSISQ